MNGKFRAVAVRGVSGPLAELLRQPFEPPPESPLARLLAGEQVVQITDMSELARLRPDDPRAQAAAEYGLRTVLFVPLRKHADLLGQVVAFREEVQPFSEKEIALLQNFAAQAVIAMENARLITETREALEQQTATAEVLQVINSSPGDLAPVFDAILEKAHRLCGATFGSLQTYDGEHFRAVAVRGGPEPFAELMRQPFRPGSEGPLARLIVGDPFVQIPDLEQLAARGADDPRTKGAIELGGIRTVLFVPLRKDTALLGYISAQRREVREFSYEEIALLQNFAAQAVVAMENARLLTETREALEQQTATAEVLQVINSSPGDLAPVFDAMLEKAVRLCEATHGHIWRYDGECFHPATAFGEPQFVQWFEQRGPVRPRFDDDNFLGRIASGERVLYIADVRETEAYRSGDSQVKALVEFSGGRSVITIALRKDEAVVGAITVYRQEVRPFSDKQIALLQNFAAQAVIAMENARLITGTREALEQQTATTEVLQVINSSPGDLGPVFNAMLEKATALCEAAFGTLSTYDGERFSPAAMYGVPPAYATFRTERGAFAPPAGSSLERVAHGESLVHIVDVTMDPGQAATPLVELGGCRTLVCVGLRKDTTLIGAITVYRQELRPFTDKQIALVKNFAAQAVIAMENARLLTETREALE
jgi:GAF domain-containing protein